MMQEIVNKNMFIYIMLFSTYIYFLQNPYHFIACNREREWLVFCDI